MSRPPRRARSPAAGSSSFRQPLSRHPPTISDASEPAGPLLPQERTGLLEILHDARDQGFLGPGPVETHLAHSLAFALLISNPPELAVDLGSGGGLPGLVLARMWPASRWILLDANKRRTDFLREAAGSLGITDRVDVLTERAEVAGQDTARRATADVVVARAFGPPAVTAECGAPFLRPGGMLVVAEPPGGDPGRWPAEGLKQLGLAADGRITTPAALQRLRLVSPCPPRYPRRTGVPHKRPLF